VAGEVEVVAAGQQEANDVQIWRLAVAVEQPIPPAISVSALATSQLDEQLVEVEERPADETSRSSTRANRGQNSS